MKLIRPNIVVVGFVGLFLAVPHEGRAGLTAQGLTAQGLTAQGLTAQGLTAQGLTAQGLTAQGLTAQGLTAQGLTAQGLTAQGLTAQGLTAQGLTAQGVVVQGTDVVAAALKGTTIGSVDIRGTDVGSAVVPHELTTGPLISAGPGDYISVAGGSAVGHYAVAHLLDPINAPAEDIDLFIASERPDPIPNLFHRAETQKNDVTLYTVYYFHKWSGQWYSLCPFNPLTNDASAIAIPEDPAGHPNKFIFACTASGVASKCARNWGYRPWQSTKAWVFSGGDWAEQTFGLKDYYDACKVAARAGYCQDSKSFTKAGTLVDLFDTRQIIWPNAIENPFNQANPDSLWMMAQEYFVSFDPAVGPVSMKASALQRTRYRELSPVGDCADLAEIDRLEHDHFEDGRWANPLANTPRIQVFSPNYCTHHEDVVGEALPWDCSPCTKNVCRAMPQCCTASPGSPGWTAACVAERLSVCQDVPGPDCSDVSGAARPCWPVGKVWPDDVPADATRSLKFLQGAGGAVERVDGVSAGASAATVIGWACDPEWPGASVAVDLYSGAPRGQAGSVLRGRAYADQALSSPLAFEVSAACDGVGLTTARHGFSFALPAGLTGNVFAYAVDALTADGPAAPPSLLRNGIVRVPTCAHSEHLPGTALDASCSACATQVCGKGGALGDCCSVAWTDSCAAAAQTCSAGDASAATNGYAFAAATTGWIEAPASGAFTFASATQPSRLFVNGVKVFDWWDAPGTTQGTINLLRGGKYALRWDRFQSAPDPSHPSPGLTWQVPGTVGQAAIPATLLYKVAPGLGTGLIGTYVPTLGLPIRNLDPVIDFSSKSPAPEGVVAPFAVTWQGEIVAPTTDTYTFYVVGDGTVTLMIDGAPVLLGDPPANSTTPACAHDVCDIGEKLAATTLAQPACSTCVDLICNPLTGDPYCCNGGYLSYYSSEPEWDAKCVAEVKSICNIDCSRPPPNPIGTQHQTAGILLQAGVRHQISLAFDSVATLTAKMQLQWASPSQNKQVIPTTQLFPDRGPVNLGAGLNAVTFATKETAAGTVADLDTLLASGSVPDLSTTAAVGPSGLPVIGVLAASDDAIAATPARPAVVQPAYNGHAVGTGGDLSVTVSGIGGVRNGSVLVTVEGVIGSGVELDVDSDGNFSGLVPTGGPTPGPRTMHFVQRTFTGASCVAPALCAQSGDLVWKFFVDTADAATAPAPTILSPRDPTASLDPSITTFLVVGKGVPNVDLHIDDLGGPGAHVAEDHLPVGPDGSFSGTITLTPGTPTDANPGWHKLSFSQGGGPATHVFVSVGIQPPTVQFPRSGAEIDCTKPDDPPLVEAKGTIPYDQTSFGRLLFTEETGRSDVRVVPARQVVVGPPVNNPDGTQSFPFDAHTLALQPGKHLVYFFQMPPIPAGATPAEALAHVRGFASVASTPKSRVEITVPPFRPAAPFPQNPTAIVKTPNDTVLGTPTPVPGQVIPCGPQATNPDPNCVSPHADVNIKIGPRLFTVRADENGAWQFHPIFPVGFNDLTLTQVVDSPFGGGWSQSCPTDTTTVGLGSTGKTPQPIVPAPITVDAVSPAGAPVAYTVSVFTNGLTSVSVTCTPASGSLFPIGRTDVHCTAFDAATKAAGIAFFPVTVIDQPPVVHVPPGGITAEATDSLGAMVSYDIKATDAVDGDLPVQCVPSAPPGAPALFLLDQDTPVTCQATDERMQTSSANFVVRVHDTTAPTLCALPDLRVDANRPLGAIVNFTTCASDLVDGAVPVNCNHPSGSFFPLGKTAVTCAATDRHGNTTPDAHFTVTVGDVVPPVLILPGNLTVTATKRTGAKVTYTATATDDSDPHPVVACAPPSGSICPLGTTVVTCTATDASGNQSHGSFTVRVVVGWSGLLLPIIDDSSVFVRNMPVRVRFRLTGASEDIHDLTARLFIAPLDAAGHPGTERPAVSMPPDTSNLFHLLPVFEEYDLLMDTRSMSRGPWRLRVDLGDGEVHTTRITLIL